MAISGLALVQREIWERAPVWETGVVVGPAAVRPAEVVRAAHQVKAWAALRGRLRPAHVREARAREEAWALSYDAYVELLRRIGEVGRLRRRVDDVDDAIEVLWAYVQDLALLPPLLPTASRRQGYRAFAPSGAYFAGFEEETRRELPPDLLAGLLGILADLTAKFLAQLEEVGRFELPPVLPAPVIVEFRQVGVGEPRPGFPGVLPPALEMEDSGDAIALQASMAAGATATVVTSILGGPSIVERIAVWAGPETNVRVQLNVQGAGVAYGASAAAATIFGDPLFLTAGIAGVAGSVLDLNASQGVAEFWPRRYVGQTGYRLVLTAQNLAGASTFVVASAERRELRRRSS